MSSTVGGTRLAYWCSSAVDRPAASRTVLLLHGLNADHDGLLTLTRLWPDTRVVSPDLPGFGRSGPLAGAHCLENYARVLDGFCAALDLRDVTVVGHSLGASIALALASAYPRRVRELVLISPVSSRNGPDTWPVRAYYGLGAALPARAARFWFLSRAAVYLSDRSMFTTADRRVRRRILESDYDTAARAEVRAIVEIYRSIRDTPMAAVAGRIPAPTVVVGGERDRLASPAALAALHRHLARSELHVVPRAGHLWSVEEPRAATRVILSALGRLAGAAVADRAG
ncbi:alpha/beta fold hydrolase [Rugosimonospora africana]|nr:alpha/beta hydrolase [Rugosimonospora africana]